MKIADGTFAGLHPSEEALFRQVLKGVFGQGVEIGCLDGYSTAVILEASNLHLTSIDPFIPDSMEPSLIGSEARLLENARQFDKLIAPGVRGTNFRLVKDYSWDYFVSEDRKRQIPAGINFLFIDGDHNYPAVLQDFKDWTPLLKTGGILALHDARMGRPGGANYHPGPSRVAHERIFGDPERWEVIGEAHSLVIARKR